MLEATIYLREFVEKLMKMNRGRAFFTTPETLGDYVLVDFVEHRTQRRGSRRHPLTPPPLVGWLWGRALGTTPRANSLQRSTGCYEIPVQSLSSQTTTAWSPACTAMRWARNADAAPMPVSPADWVG